MINLEEFLTHEKKILVTGGAGFIGGAVIRNLITRSNFKIFNLDKMGYASDLTSINQCLKGKDLKTQRRYKLLNVNLTNHSSLRDAVEFSKPDIIMHLAAESSVDKSIVNPREFIESNILGTYNLLDVSYEYFKNLKSSKKDKFLFHHISTDEVFGSLGKTGKFREDSNYKPRSPYSSSKASSDHLVEAWYHTYGLPVIITNCSNNFGPWQFPEKLIPVIINNGIKKKVIPIYGDGENIRDWLFVEDHVEALLNVICKSEVGESFCIGGNSEKSNIEVANTICYFLDRFRPYDNSYSSLIKFVPDRKGHDERYAIDIEKIKKKLGWQPKIEFSKGIEITIKWYLNNMLWIDSLSKNKCH